ncbi:hypothetical protein MKW92_004743 [Papaver armeniacum]|nr:hypothetical protein MKW92_004743 [Papaver armeniacum]
MVQIHTLHVQEEIKNCSAEQFYSFLKHEMTKLPQVCPHIFKSFEILDGDGKSAGTVRLLKIATGASHEEILKDTIVSVDDESKTLSVRSINGDFLRMYPKFEYTTTATPLITQIGEQSCLVKLSVEYEKENEDVPPPHGYAELAVSMYKAIASHLASKA